MGYRMVGVCLMGVLSGCLELEGNGHEVTETREVREISRVENESPFDVDIEQGQEFRVRVRIDSNLQRVVETRVRNDVLHIQADEWFIDVPPGPHVLITMPRLDKLENNGSGSVFAAWFEQDDEVELRLSGSGDLSFEGAVPSIVSELNGSGDLYLSGNTESAELSIRGSGDIEARDLTAAEADLTVDGSGDLRVTVDGPVDARVDGSGDVELSGDVRRGRFSENGSGRIQVR